MEKWQADIAAAFIVCAHRVEHVMLRTDPAGRPWLVVGFGPAGSYGFKGSHGSNILTTLDRSKTA